MLSKKQSYFYFFTILFVLLTLAFYLDKRLPKLSIYNLEPTLSKVSMYLEGDNNNYYFVKQVVDGDTIVLQNGQRVRYIGIDTPEVGDKDECFSQEATAINKSLVLNKFVKLQKDSSETDRYGRLLRYVYVDNIMVNEYLVNEGFAKAVYIKPDTTLYPKFKLLESSAKAQNKGLWGSCTNN